MIRLAPIDSRAMEVVEKLMSDAYSRSEWQAMWIVSAARQISMLDGDSGRRAWVMGQLRRGQGGLLGAESTLALAEVGAIEFDHLDRALRLEPAPLAPWFVLAMRALESVDPSVSQRVAAVRKSSPLFEALLG